MADSRSYAWTGTPRASASVERVNGVEVRRNIAPTVPEVLLGPPAVTVPEVQFDGRMWRRFNTPGGGALRFNMNSLGVPGRTLIGISVTFANPGTTPASMALDVGDDNQIFVTLAPGEVRTVSTSAAPQADNVYQFADIEGAQNGTAQNFLFTDVIIEVGKTAGPYFDGASLWGTSNSWTGAPHGSRSLQRVNGQVTRVNLQQDPAPVSTWGAYSGSNNGAPATATLANLLVPEFPSGRSWRMTWVTPPTDGWNASKGYDGVVPGRTYTFSAYARGSFPGSGTRLTVEFQDASGRNLTGYNSGNAVLMSPTEPRRIFFTAVAPPNAVKGNMFFDNGLGVMPASGDWVEVSSALVEEATSPGTYFDGASPWNLLGAVNASSSSTSAAMSAPAPSSSVPRSSAPLTSAQVAVEFANIVERISDDESMAWGSVPAVLSVDYEQVGPFRVGDSPLTAWAIEVDSEVNLYGVFDSGEVSILDPEGNVVAVRPSEFIDSDTLIVTIPVGTFTTAGIYRLVPRLLGRGAVTLQAVSVIIEAEDGWHDLESARDEWQDAPAGDPQLFTMLQSAKVQCLAFAPALSGRPPANYRQAQLLQARALWQAVRTNPDGQLDANGFSVHVYPLDRNIRALLRPRTGVPVFA
jgi:hypothetical protein